METAARIRIYLLSCGAHFRNTEVLPNGATPRCPEHPSVKHAVVKKLRVEVL